MIVKRGTGAASSSYSGSKRASQYFENSSGASKAEEEKKTDEENRILQEKQAAREIRSLVRDAMDIKNNPSNASNYSTARLNELKARAGGFLEQGVNPPTQLQQKSQKERGYSTYRTPEEEVEIELASRKFPTGPNVPVSVLEGLPAEARDKAIAAEAPESVATTASYPDAQYFLYGGRLYAGRAAGEKIRELNKTMGGRQYVQGYMERLAKGENPAAEYITQTDVLKTIYSNKQNKSYSLALNGLSIGVVETTTFEKGFKTPEGQQRYLTNISQKQTQEVEKEYDKYSNLGISISGFELKGDLTKPKNQTTPQTQTTSTTTTVTTTPKLQEMGIIGNLPIIGPAIEEVGKTIYGDVKLFAGKITEKPYGYEQDKIKERYNLTEEQYNNFNFLGKMALSPKSSAFGGRYSEKNAYKENAEEIYNIRLTSLNKNFQENIQNIQKAQATVGGYITVDGKRIEGKDLTQYGNDLQKEYTKNLALLKEEKKELSGEGTVPIKIPYMDKEYELGSVPRSLFSQEIGFQKDPLTGLIPIPKNIRTVETIGGGVIVGLTALGGMTAAITPTKLGGMGLTTRAGVVYSGVKGLSILPTIRYATKFVDTSLENTPEDAFRVASLVTPIGVISNALTLSPDKTVSSFGETLSKQTAKETKEVIRYGGYYLTIGGGEKAIDKSFKVTFPTRTTITDTTYNRYSTGEMEGLNPLTTEIKTYNINRNTRGLGTQTDVVTEVNLIKESQQLSSSILNPATKVGGKYTEVTKTRGYNLWESGDFFGLQRERNFGFDRITSTTKIPTYRNYKTILKPYSSYAVQKTNYETGLTKTETFNTDLYGKSLYQLRSEKPPQGIGLSSKKYSKKLYPSYNYLVRMEKSKLPTFSISGSPLKNGGGAGTSTEMKIKNQLKNDWFKRNFAMQQNAGGYDYAYFIGEPASFSSKYSAPSPPAFMSRSSPLSAGRIGGLVNINRNMQTDRLKSINTLSQSQLQNSANSQLLKSQTVDINKNLQTNNLQNLNRQLNLNTLTNLQNNVRANANRQQLVNVNSYPILYDYVRTNFDTNPTGNITPKPKTDKLPLWDDIFGASGLTIPRGGRGRRSRQKSVKLGVDAASVLGEVVGFKQVKKKRRRRKK